jgi:hypothetical protein
MKHTHKNHSMKWRGMSLLAILCPAVAAQEPTLSLFASADHRELGSAFAAVGDLNGDGTPDIAVADRSARIQSFASSGAVHILSGADGTLLRTYLGSPASSQSFGSSLAVLDADGDGIPDLAVGSPGQAGPSGFGAGAVRVYSGADGSLISQIIGPAQSQLGASLANAGDQNGDGTEDLYAGAPMGDSSRGAVLVISGKDGSVIRTLLTDASTSAFGLTLVALDDMDGDGRADLAVGAPGFRIGSNQVGRVLLIRSSDGTVASQIAGSGNFTRLGQSLAKTGDADGDGRADFLIGSYSGGTALLASGANLSILGDFSVPTLPAFRALTVGGALDFDGDGVGDMLLGSNALGVVNGLTVGGMRIVSGADHSILFERLASASFTGLGDFMAVLPGLGFAAGEPNLRNLATGGDGAAYLWVLTLDSDGDGVPDDRDSIPHSIMGPTVIVAGVDSGVPNLVDEQGRTTADRMAEIGNPADYRNPALFYVAALQHAKQLANEGVLDREGQRKIKNAAHKGTVGAKGAR